MLVKIGKYFYRLQGFRADGCYHTCKRFLDAGGYQRADKLTYIIKQHARIVPKSSYMYEFNYTYKVKRAY